jgi:Dihydrouridine synthase (Dus)
MWLQEGGAAFVTLHPRTKVQSYTGRADWDHIASAKALLSIPVVRLSTAHLHVSPSLVLSGMSYPRACGAVRGHIAQPPCCISHAGGQW